MKRISNFFILIILLIILIIFIYFINKNKRESNLESFQNNSNADFKYYRCENKLLGKILKNVFDTNNITHSNNDWNIYIPCGYNDVEEELQKILIKKNPSTKYIFGLNGCDSIVSKNKIWESLVKCYGRKDASYLMPESYILDDPNEMQVFRKNFNPSKKNIYILKKNVQRKEGLKLTRDYFEILEGVSDNYRVAQKYITDLYLINQRKVNLRIYLLIVIKEKTIYFYMCKNGKCIYTNKKYNDNDLDFESNITSYNLDMTVYKTNPRNFDELKIYIDETSGKDKGDLLFDNIELLMRKVSLCLSKNFFQSKNIEGSVTFQLFGGDVIFDKELHPYLLEFNKGPDMTPRDVTDETMKNLVQSDMFKTIGVLPNNEENSFSLIYRNKIEPGAGDSN